MNSLSQYFSDDYKASSQLLFMAYLSNQSFQVGICPCLDKKYFNYIDKKIKEFFDLSS
tara:strand:- start:388 stop:561 length:174 start_codon:yes stop_codon:yes gene_type:complete